MYETSGVLRRAITVYLYGGELTAEQTATLRAYFRQWIGARCWDHNPHAGVEDRAWLTRIRAEVDGLTSRKAIERWLSETRRKGIDPL